MYFVCYTEFNDVIVRQNIILAKHLSCYLRGPLGDKSRVVLLLYILLNVIRFYL